MKLQEAVQAVVDEFNYSDEDIQRATKQFLEEMDLGLKKTGRPMAQIPTYVTAVPNGTEKGLYMAVDLGGTNFRVCSINLHGNTTFTLTQTKVKIPQELMVAPTAKELFAFLAKQIKHFIVTHHNDHFQSHLEKRGSGETIHDEEIFSLGFTFSFPVHQVGINKGMLIRWTKGFDIKDAVGKDVCALLQHEIDALHLPVKVAALVNDTVGTLMARSYTSPGKTGTLLGAIFGTGTNGAYVEKLHRITKLHTELKGSEYDDSTGEMIVNSEWGSFDAELKVLPNTPYDRDLDVESNNPGFQLFEKRISGMFLGEILRRAMLALVRNPKAGFCSAKDSSFNDLHSTTIVNTGSPIFTQWGIDTAFLSTAEGDTSAGLRLTRQAMHKEFDIDSASEEDARAVKALASAIGRRAARLSGMAIGAVVVASGKLDQPGAGKTDEQGRPSAVPVEGEEDSTIDVGVDGSLVEFYPNFEQYMREALRAIPEIGEKGEKRIRIGIAKDGSGVGAALIALVADRAGAAKPK